MAAEVRLLLGLAALPNGMGSLVSNSWAGFNIPPKSFCFGVHMAIVTFITSPWFLYGVPVAAVLISGTAFLCAFRKSKH